MSYRVYYIERNGSEAFSTAIKSFKSRDKATDFAKLKGLDGLLPIAVIERIYENRKIVSEAIDMSNDLFERMKNEELLLAMSDSFTLTDLGYKLVSRIIKDHNATKRRSKNMLSRKKEPIPQDQLLESAYYNVFTPDPHYVSELLDRMCKIYDTNLENTTYYLDRIEVEFKNGIRGKIIPTDGDTSTTDISIRFIRYKSTC